MSFALNPSSPQAVPAGVEFAQDRQWQEALKRCSPPTRAAAVAFRRSGDPACLPVIIDGLLARHIEAGRLPRLEQGGPQLRLVEDLGVDSLSMMEIVLVAEEVFGISIGGEELRAVRTKGDMTDLMARKTKRGAATAG